MLAVLVALAIAGPASAQDDARDDEVERAIVSIGAIRIEGAGLSEPAVRRGITRHVPELRACWGASRSSPPVPVRLVVASDGRVEDASATLDGEGAAFAACVATSARGWTFSRGEGSAVVVTLSLRVHRNPYGYGIDPLPGRFPVLPQVRFARPVVRSGAITPRAVLLVLRRHQNEVRFCYERMLAQRPDLAGTIDVAVAIAADGSVTASTLARSTVGEPQVEECVVHAFRRWRFPALPEGIAVVEASMRFSAPR